MRKTPPGRRFLRAAGISAWILSGIPAVAMLSGRAVFDGERLSLAPERFLLWLLAALVFAAAFWKSSGSAVEEPFRRRAQALLVVQSLAALTMFQVVCTGLETMLLMVVAAQLGLFVRLGYGVAWVIVQSAALAWLGVAHAGLGWSLGWTFLSLPVAALALFTSYYAASEAHARHQLARANAELVATQRILAGASRMAERSRISRELHDLLGHHLSALSLNLEVALHQAEGAPREQIAKCQDLTRRLLGDVREAVRTLRRDEPMDLTGVLAPLVEDIPRPRIHLDLPPDLAVADPERVQALVRCVQEIVTNAVKHAGAENLWIDVIQTTGGLEIRARDDGRGAPDVRPGHGLSGMRERLEALGGGLELLTAQGHGSPNQGFALAARLPLPEAAP